MCAAVAEPRAGLRAGGCNRIGLGTGSPIPIPTPTPTLTLTLTLTLTTSAHYAGLVSARLLCSMPPSHMSWPSAAT